MASWVNSPFGLRPHGLLTQSPFRLLTSPYSLCTMFRAVHSMHFISVSLGSSVSFPWGKFHFLIKTITDWVRLGVVYLNLVFSTANGVMFCEIYVQSAAHITTIHDSFIYFISFFKTFPRSSILHHQSSILDPRSWFSSKPRSFAH